MVFQSNSSNNPIISGTIRLFAADTLDDLADHLGLTGEKKDNFLASVKNYNAKCAAGYDDDYGKDPSVLFAVQKAPYYAFSKDIYAGYEFLCTTGGLWTDNNQNVYDEYLDVIPGLYATGNCCGRRFGVQYSTPHCRCQCRHGADSGSYPWHSSGTVVSVFSFFLINIV